MLCPIIVGTRAKKKNQGSSFDETEKTETPANKEITKSVQAAKKNNQRVYSKTPKLFLMFFPTIKTKAIATEHKTAKTFPSVPVSPKDPWLTKTAAPKNAKNKPSKTIGRGERFLKTKLYISVNIGAVVPKRAASAIDVS